MIQTIRSNILPITSHKISHRIRNVRNYSILLAVALGLSGCQSLPDIPKIKLPPAIKLPGRTPTPTPPPTPAPNPSTPTPPVAAVPTNPDSLARAISEKWRAFPGKTGVAVHRVGSSWTVGERLDDFFPQQSVSKMWVALTILDQIDKGVLQMDQMVKIGRSDLAVFHSPVRDRVVREGELSYPIRTLLEFAITESDNTANDRLMRLAGGPTAIREFVERQGLGAIRFGPGERLLQSGIAGMEWKQEYAIGNAFFEARNKVPLSTRRAALQRYIADPVDGASPRAIALALNKLTSGALLSPSSTSHMLGLMSRVKSGPQRLKAGVPSGWRFGHKTGTGQVLSPISTGYNDIGIMTAPDGTRYSIVVMLSDTTASVPDRMQFMQSISRAVGLFHSGLLETGQ
jgi:beta-lactamase class A